LIDLQTFDVITYLEDRGIQFWTSGKNVTSGWINISCPFPFCQEPSNHLGISPHRFFNCWVCGEKGPVTKLIQQLEGCSWTEANTIVSKFQDFTFKHLKKETQHRTDPDRNILPKEANDDWPQLHLDYLKKRGFNPPSLINKYKLKACYTLGKYKFRIIVPFFHKGKIVNFTGLDVTNQAKEPYKHCLNEEAIIPAKSCLYNIDTVDRSVLIVEGVTDVWRIGDGCIASLGIEWTNAQIGLLIEKSLERVFVMFDSEPKAVAKAHELGEHLSAIFPSVEVIELSEGDPCDLDPGTVRKVRKNFLREKQ